MMNFIGAADIERLVDYPSMIDAVEMAFRSGVITPVRHHHSVTRPAGSQTTLLLMPAWTDFTQLKGGESGYIGVKIVTVSPDNGALNKPAIMGAAVRRDKHRVLRIALFASYGCSQNFLPTSNIDYIRRIDKPLRFRISS